MPTQSTTYNSRVTDEALEKRFRDTFRSQGGAELVDDLYAQGVIVPVVDFTAAATGQQLGPDLQTAWDFSTGSSQITGTNTSIITNAGFWLVDITASVFIDASALSTWQLNLFDGTSSKPIWAFTSNSLGGTLTGSVVEAKFVVFLRAGDSLRATTPDSRFPIDVWYRQIATVSGDLIDPSGFTSS